MSDIYDYLGYEIPSLIVEQVDPNKMKTRMNTPEKAVSALLCFKCSIVNKSFIIKVL